MRALWQGNKIRLETRQGLNTWYNWALNTKQRQRNMGGSKKQARWRRLLRKAANLLSRSYWHTSTCFRKVTGAISQPACQDDANSFCMVGAIRKACNLPEYGDGVIGMYRGDTKDATFNKAIKALMNAKGLSDDVYRINDRILGDKDLVVAFMREVANG